MPSCRLAPLAAGLALALASTSIARAEAEPDGAAVMERIGRIERALDEAAGPARTWRGAWLLTHGLLATGQTTLAFAIEDVEKKRSYAVGASKSGVGFLAALLFPHPATHAGLDLRRFPASTPAERRAKLVEAERLVDSAAAGQRRARGIIAHLGALVVNGAGAIVLWRGYDQGKDGAVSFLTGMAVAETQIFTAPTGAIDGRDAYRKDFSIALAPHPGGASLVGTF